ncbi:MAG: sugar transferase [Synechococcales bacterium]|nr:sugar transferase [Cyanobacteria bacterium REEB444]MEB3124234.1 sugar transferase [Synechococcales bacterium]
MLEVKSGKVRRIAKMIPRLIFIADIISLFTLITLDLYLRIGYIQVISSVVMYGFGLFIILGLYLLDTYHPDKQIAGMRSGARVLLSNSITYIIYSYLSYPIKIRLPELSIDKITFLYGITLFTFFAITVRLFLAKLERLDGEKYPWLLIGLGEKSKTFINILDQEKIKSQFILIGKDKQDISQFKVQNQLLIKTDHSVHLEHWIQSPLAGVIVGDGLGISESLVRILMKLRLYGTPVYKLPDACEELFLKISPSLLDDNWFTFNNGFNLISGGITIRLKTIMDFIFGMMLIVLLSPILFITAILIKLDSPGTIIYHQKRTGLHGRTFEIYKFRSMYENAEEKGAQWTSKRDLRITRVGYWLRILRIDELPQIINVLRGEMSLIGPRPERPEFDVQLEKIIPYYELRYLVKPGITGWAQVYYPYGASIEDAYEKLAYDLYYIKNYSLWLDFAITLKTIRVILLGKGR